MSGLPGLEQLRSISKFGLSQVVVVCSRRHRHLLCPAVDQRATGDASRFPTAVGAAEDGAGGDRPGRGVSLHRHRRRGPTRPSCARSTTGSSSRSMRHRARHGRNQQLGRLREAVSDPHRSRSAGQARPDVRRGGRRPSKRTTSTSAAATSAKTSGDAARAGTGPHDDIEQIQHIVITAEEGVPIRDRDVAEVVIGHEIRRGAVTANGQGEVVLGPGLHAHGRKQPHRHLGHEGQAESRSKHACRPNVQVKPFTTARELVDFVIDTVRKNLFEGGLLVVAVLFGFLGQSAGRADRGRWPFRCRCCSPSAACCGSASPPACSAWGPSTSA